MKPLSRFALATLIFGGFCLAAMMALWMFFLALCGDDEDADEFFDSYG